MPSIKVAILNSTSSDQIAHVYDKFAGGTREVTGSPFALASDEASEYFLVNANAEGEGKIDYNCQGGPSLSQVEVEDGDTVEIT